MDAAGAQAELGDLESPALAQQHVRCRHPGVLEGDVHVAVWGVVVAEDLHRMVDGDTGGVDGHEDLRLAAVRRTIGAGLQHRDHDLAARVARS